MYLIGCPSLRQIIMVIWNMYENKMSYDLFLPYAKQTRVRWRRVATPKPCLLLCCLWTCRPSRAARDCVKLSHSVKLWPTATARATCTRQARQPPPVRQASRTPLNSAWVSSPDTTISILQSPYTVSCHHIGIFYIITQPGLCLKKGPVFHPTPVTQLVKQLLLKG